MSKLIRFGVSLSSDLLKQFDKLIDQKGYKNRSEAIRDLIREELISEEWKEGGRETVGVFSLVYDHHRNDLSQVINNIQHDNLDIIRSSTHVHIDHKNCLEVIILKGKSSEIKKLTDRLTSTKGIKHGKLIMTSTGSDLT
ncbi:MAG: nickel-responsive transcriptional regulator NikR [Candidatus Aminicenantes bacterium]|nr:nickel-responsive transcriptional regulator NikR [Candidatus Aminicenantes bacterium]